MTQKSYNLILAFAVPVIAFSVYLMTLAPTVWFIDSGELSAVASSLGIAHPTGYPLFTIIGHLFTLLPFSSSEVYKLNLMSAFFCTLGVFVFSFLMRYLISKMQLIYKKESPKAGSGSKKEKISEIPETVKWGIVIFSCLILAFSKTYWAAANSVEVYPMHIFFVITLMLVFLKAIYNTRKEENKGSFINENRYYLIFAFLLGFSFTNHLTTILLAPACLTLFFYKNLYNRSRLYRLLGFMALCFLVGFSVYLYLPVRASMNPPFLWGNPYNFERFYWHITGKQFSVWIFSAKGSIPAFLLLMGSTVALSVYGLVKQKSLNQNLHFIFFIIICTIGYVVISSSNPIVLQQFQKFSGSLWNEFGTALVLFSILGIYFLSKFNLTVYYFTILAFFGCLFYSINYDINDIYSYFLLAYIAIAVWIGFGALFLCELTVNSLKSHAQKLVFAIILVLLGLITLNTNYSANDESKNYYVEELTMNMFKNAAPNSIIISSQWDFWVSASWYFNFIKNIRRDIIVVDKELLRRSWYYKYLEQHYPEFYQNSKHEIDRFLAELYKFEHNIPYDQTIVKAFEDMITSFVTNNPMRRVYTTWEIEQNRNEPFAKDYARVPDGLMFRLVHNDSIKNNIVSDYEIYDFKFTPTARNDYYHETLMFSYSVMLTTSANYLLNINRIQDAKKYLELAILAKPNYPQAIELKRKYSL
ncbi:MAG: DUF2723 domain-containing protein [Chlorobi bacterium]|nr:DUF2723 domain-containing protein [Chlorobiota bacterium]MCI0717109.1 DUF2723 domain-containing protein [Chlorobiota bacterium]